MYDASGCNVNVIHECSTTILPPSEGVMQDVLASEYDDLNE